MKKAQHVIPNGSKWSVKKSGSTRATKTFNTKEEAKSFGKTIAKNQKVDLYIHKKDGRIEAKIVSKRTPVARSVKK